MRFEKTLTASALVATGVLATALPAQAAPATYEAAVNANDPYVYYRLQDTGTLANAEAEDFSLNNRDPGVYRGDPTGGIDGTGLLSDTAVSFPGATDTGLDYLRTTDTLGFGSQVGQSSYELIFRTNTANPEDYQALFGVFNASTETGRTANEAVSIELNSNATGNASAGTSRFYVRDEDGIALGGVIENGDLLDGNYHHLVFTYDMTAGADNFIAAYVDGVEVPVAHVHQGGGDATNFPDNFMDFTRDPVFGARNVRGTVGLEANVTIDEAALYGNTILSPEQVAFNATAAGFVIPEPGSLALLSMAGLGLLRRRRA